MTVLPTAKVPEIFGKGASVNDRLLTDDLVLDVASSVGVGVGLGEGVGVDVVLGSGTGVGVSTGAGVDVSTGAGVDVGVEALGAGVALESAAKTGAETPSCTSVEIANAKPIDAELRLNRPNSFTKCPRTRNLY